MSRPSTPPPSNNNNNNNNNNSSSSSASSPRVSAINLQQLARSPSQQDLSFQQQLPSASASAPADVKIGKGDVEEALLGKDSQGKMMGGGTGGQAVGNPIWPVMSYCGASIMMTVVNKFVVSGHHFTMTFLLLTIQSVVCCGSVWIAKKLGLISFRDFDMKDAKIWFPISALLVSVIYTGSKSLQFLSIPVYTIFKNLSIILIAYGEVIWFGGHVSGLTLCSFALMVGSSVIAAWSDVTNALAAKSYQAETLDPTTGAEIPIQSGSIVGMLNVGYLWMGLNCFFAAAYVLSMRKRIKLTGFKDWDSMFYNNLLCIPVLIVASVLIEDWGFESLNLNFPAETRGFLLFAMAFSGAAAVFISYTTAWCIRTTSSTTYSMVGALNKLPVAASGMIFFGDPVNFGSVSAVGTGFIAGLVYAMAKQAQARANKARDAAGAAFGMKEKS